MTRETRHALAPYRSVPIARAHHGAPLHVGPLHSPCARYSSGCRLDPLRRASSGLRRPPGRRAGVGASRLRGHDHHPGLGCDGSGVASGVPLGHPGVTQRDRRHRGLLRSDHQTAGGAGSKELRTPTTLFVSQDSLFIGDWGQRRTTVWSPAGRLVRTFPTANALRGTLPQARDSRGNFYLDQYPPAGPDGSGNRDSAAVLLVDAGFARADTIAQLAPLDIAEVVGDAGRRFERRVFGG